MWRRDGCGLCAAARFSSGMRFCAGFGLVASGKPGGGVGRLARESVLAFKENSHPRIKSWNSMASSSMGLENAKQPSRAVAIGMPFGNHDTTEMSAPASPILLAPPRRSARTRKESRG